MNASKFVPFPIHDARKDLSVAGLYPRFPVVAYHAKCFDGMGAALEAWHALDGKCIMYALDYKDDIPEFFSSRIIYFVDFCPTADQLKELVEKPKAFIHILDHHAGRCEEVMDVISTWDEALQDRICFEYDRLHSGAYISWQYFNPNGTPLACMKDGPPAYISYIEDHDLWQFEQLNTKAFVAFLGLLPWDLATWYDAVYTTAPSLAITIGQLVLAKRQEELERYMDKAVILNVKDRLVAFCNAPKQYASDLGSMLCTRRGISYAVIFEYDYHYEKVTVSGSLVSPSMVVSIRTTDSGPAAYDLAKGLGGGGHRNASGATIPVSHEDMLGALLRDIETVFDMEDMIHAP